MAFDGFRDFILGEFPELKLSEDELEAFSDDLKSEALDWVHKHRREYAAADRVGATCVYSILEELDSVLHDSAYPGDPGDKDFVTIRLTNGDVEIIRGSDYDSTFAGYPLWYKCLWEAVSDRELDKSQAANLSSKQIVQFWQSCL